MMWQNETAIRISDGRDYERGQGGDQVITHDAQLHPPCQYVIQKRGTEGFTAGGFGRRASQKGMCEQFVDKRGMHAASSRSRAVFVELLLASAQASDGPIERHVSRTRIKGQYICQLSSGGQNCHVADATDIVDDARALRITKQHVVHIWRQRSPFPTGCHVAWA